MLRLFVFGLGYSALAIAGRVMQEGWTVAGTTRSREGADLLERRGIADPKRLGVTGGSGGGLLTNWTITQTDRFAGQVMADHDYVDDLVKTLPDAYQVLSRNGLYGDYFGFYLCDAILKVNGKGGHPVYVKLAGHDTGRCTPK